MKKNKGFATIAIIVIVVAVLAIGGGVYYLKTKNNNGSFNGPVKSVDVANSKFVLAFSTNPGPGDITVITSNATQFKKGNDNGVFADVVVGAKVSANGSYDSQTKELKATEVKVLFVNPNVATTTTTTTACLPTTAPWIKVLSPNGGEVYKMGDTITIKWGTCNAKPEQTVTLGMGQVIPPYNGVPEGFHPSVRFSPTEISNSGITTVKLDASSVSIISRLNGVWPFTSGSNYKILATLNPSSTNTEETPSVGDSSDNTFTINSLPNSTSTTTLPTPYIAGQSNWPPVIKISNTTYSCIPSSSEMEKTVEKVINGKTYCVTTFTEGAAGHSYITYTYKTASSAVATKTTSFTLGYQSCGGYSDSTQLTCKNAQSGFKLDMIIDSLM